MTLLGGFSVSLGSRVLEENAWRLKNAAALVKLLALAPRHRLHREQVMDLLWPESGRKAASNSLRRVLHSARGALDPVAGSRYLVSKDDSLLLCPDSSLWVDLEAFEEAGATARAAGILQPTERRSTCMPGAVARRPLRGVGGGEKRCASAAVSGPARRTCQSLRGTR